MESQPQNPENLESRPQNPENFHSQNAELDHNSFSDLYSAFLRKIDHLNLKLWIFSGHTASFKIQVSKVQDFGNFELSWM